jgi:hypothetical protein
MTNKPSQVDKLDDPIGNDASRPYAQLVGQLLYLVNCTRPGMIHLSRVLSKPIHSHWVQAKRILRHLNGAKDTFLTNYGGISLELVFLARRLLC